MQIGPFGLPELLAILAIALVVFGPKRLPELSRSLGKAIGEFRRGTTDLRRSLEDEVRSLDREVREEEEAREGRTADEGRGRPSPAREFPEAAADGISDGRDGEQGPGPEEEGEGP